jgi:hypothetical protein
MGMFAPKTPKISQSVLDAERKAKEAEEKAAKDAAQLELDKEYKAKKQRGKASTIITGDQKSSGTGTGRTLLGG